MKDVGTYKSSFVTGQQVLVTLFAVGSNNKLYPIVTNFDKLDIEVQIKSKKNRSIGMSTSRTQTSIEGYRLTLSRAKQDGIIETESLLNQAHMMAYLPNREYVIRLQINHSYSKNQLRGLPEAADFNLSNVLNDVGNEIAKSARRVAANEANRLLKGALNEGKQQVEKLNTNINNAINKVPNKIAQRGLRFAKDVLIPNNRPTQGFLKKPVDAIKGIIKRGTDIIGGIGKLGITPPEVYTEVYDFQYCSITSNSIGFEPKELSKNGLTFEGSFIESSTESNIETQYQYNAALASTIAKFENERTLDNNLYEQRDRTARIQENLANNNPIQVTYPSIFINRTSLDIMTTQQEIQEKINEMIH